MAEQVFGLDFGTTNSLLSVIGADGRPVHLTDERIDRPHPSVVWYRAGEVIVGRNAREHLDAGVDAITGSFVRSPKRLLDQDALIHVSGREIDPRDVVSEVLKFLRTDAAEGRADKYIISRAVMTIPVKLDGSGRRRLRESARKAGIGVVQFVQEPLAALYAYMRSQPDYRRRLAELDGCRVLVFDWGGGTLDLTLCQIQRDQIVQIASIGDNEVGGDRFDELIRNKVRDAHARQYGIDDLSGIERHEARILLLNQCELRKIELSERDTATAFVRNYLRREGLGSDLSVSISRAQVSEWTRELVERGLGAIDALLDQNGLSYQQISLCLPTGGMVDMPAIRDGLNERFGARAPRLSNGDRIISEGAAWIAYDDLRPGLAKPIELLQSDDTYATVVPLPFTLPIENEVKGAARATYHCVDPRSGRASFTFARPNRPTSRDVSSDRRAYTTLHLEVDDEAPPLMERIKLELTVDPDYVAQVHLESTMRKDRIKAEIFDLEFTLTFPLGADSGSISDDEISVATKVLPNHVDPKVRKVRYGNIRLSSNISVDLSWGKVPGDLITAYRPNWFDDRSREYSDWQYNQYIYYKDCPYCHRSRYQFRTLGCQKSQCLWRYAHRAIQSNHTSSFRE